MLPSQLPTVKPAPLAVLKEQAIIWLPCGLLALLLWATGLDTTLARAFYQPDLEHHLFILATVLRHYGTLPGTLFTVAALVVMFWPGLWKSRPLLYRVALVTTLTAVFGIGLVNQTLVKKLADRPRPHESVITNTETFPDGFRGNSMPSGHAAMGFIFTAPFFPLRRSHPRLAKAALGTGLIAGVALGLSRMVLGAHFATDVLIAAAITLSAAALFTLLTLKIQRVPHKIISLGLLVFALAVVLGNRFSGLTLTLELPQPFKQISLPCPVTAVPAAVSVPTLTIRLSGYGAPLSTLNLSNQGDTISLQRHLGLYHHLNCTAQLSLPPAE